MGCWQLSWRACALREGKGVCTPTGASLPMKSGRPATDRQTARPAARHKVTLWLTRFTLSRGKTVSPCGGSVTLRFALNHGGKLADEIGR